MTSDLGVWTADDCALVLIVCRRRRLGVTRTQTEELSASLMTT